MPELMTTAEVAELLRVREDTVRWWRHVERGPKGFSLGGHRGRVVYDRAVVEAWIAEQAARDNEQR